MPAARGGEDAGLVTGHERQARGLALGCVLAWAAATTSARWLGVWPAVGGVAVLLGLVVLAADRRETLRLLQPRARHVLAGFAAGVVMALATLIAYPHVGRMAPAVTSQVAGLYAAVRQLPPGVIALLLVPVVLGEDLVWRGVVQGTLASRTGRIGGLLLAALAYALAQAPLGTPVLVLVALGGALIWGGLRAWSDSLVPTVVAHLVWDVVVLLARPLDS